MTTLPLRTSFSRRSLLLGLSATALVTSACTVGDWRPSKPPAAGVQTEIGEIKLRNLILVTDEKGSAVLFGSGWTGEGDTLVSVTVTPRDGAAPGDETRTYETNLALPAQTLTPTTVSFSDPRLKAGRTAEVTFRFARQGERTLQVPSLAHTHPDFSAAWAAARS